MATPRAGIARGEIKKVREAYDNGVPVKLVAKGMKVPVKCIQSFYDHFDDPSKLGDRHAKIAKASKTDAFLKKEKEAMDNILAKQSAEKKLGIQEETVVPPTEVEEKAMLERLQNKYKNDTPVDTLTPPEEDIPVDIPTPPVEDTDPKYETPEWDKLTPPQKAAITRRRNAAKKAK